LKAKVYIQEIPCIYPSQGANAWENNKKVYIQELPSIFPSHRANVWVEIQYLYHLLMGPGVVSCLTRILSVRLILGDWCFLHLSRTRTNWIASC